MANRKAKARIFCDWYYPNSYATATRWGPIVQELRDQGMEVLIHTDKSSEKEWGCKSNRIRSPRNDYSVVKRLSTEILLGLEWFFKAMFLPSNLIFLTSPPFFSAFGAALGCVISRRNYILDVRDLYPEVYVEAKLIRRRSIFHKILMGMERFMYCNSKQSFSVTPLLVEHIGQNGAELRNGLLRNGYDHKLFQASKEKHHGFTIAFHGNIGRFQNPELLLEIAKLVEEQDPEIRFIVIGDGPKSYLFKTNLPSNVEYLGRMKQYKLAKVVAKCHLGLSFRSEDGISNRSIPVRLYENIGLTIPSIVVPRRSEGAEFVEKNKIGKSIDTDARQIADYIMMLKSNTEGYREMISNTIKIKHQYSRTKISSEFVHHVLNTVNHV